MTEQEWAASTDPQGMLKFLQGTGWLSERKLRLFIVSVNRRVWSLLNDEQVRTAVEIAEQFADGLVDQERLYTALGEDRDTYDWLGGVRDVAYHACRPPGALEIHDASRASRLAATALGRATFPDADFEHDAYLGAASVREAEAEAHASLLRCLIGPLPFRSVVIAAAWLTWKDGAVLEQAQAIYNTQFFDQLPMLADSLEQSGCSNADILAHCRGPGPHGRGCWPVDLILGKS